MHTFAKNRPAPTVTDIGEGTRCLAHRLQLEIIEKDPRYLARLNTGD